MGHLINKQNVIIRSMLLLFVSIALLGCVDAHYSTRPPVLAESHTHVVHVPGTYVYAVPDTTAEVFFYGGRWFSYHDNYWFRASVYSGPWVRVRIGNVPPRLHKLPGHYRHHIHSNSHRIHRHELRKHWKRWERDRHWDHDDDHDDGRYKKKKHKGRGGYYKKGHDEERSLAGAVKEKVERRTGKSYEYKKKSDNYRGNRHSKKDHKKKVKQYKKRHDDGRSLAGAIKAEVKRQNKGKERKIKERDSQREDDGKNKRKKKDKKQKTKKKQKKDRDGGEDRDDKSKKESKGKAKRYNNSGGGGNSLAGAIMRGFENK